MRRRARDRRHRRIGRGPLSPRVGRLSRDPYRGARAGRAVGAARRRGRLGRPATAARLDPRRAAGARRAARAARRAGRDRSSERLRGTTDSPVFLDAGRRRDREGLYPGGAFHAVDVVLARERRDRRSPRHQPGREAPAPSARRALLRPTRAADHPARRAGRRGLAAQDGRRRSRPSTGRSRTRVGARHRHLDRAGGRAGVHLPRRRAARPTLLDSRDSARLRAHGAPPGGAPADTRPVGAHRSGSVVRALADAVPPIEEDRTLSPEVARVRALVASGATRRPEHADYAAPPMARRVPAAPSTRTRVKRVHDRAAYDRATIDAILDAALVCHLGFEHEGQPFVIPTLHARIGDLLYVHGSSASRHGPRARRGHPGLRHGDAASTGSSSRAPCSSTRSTTAPSSCSAPRRRSTDPDEKHAVLEAFTEKLLPGRWADARPPTRKELKATGRALAPARRGVGQGARRAPGRRRLPGRRARRLGRVRSRSS